MFVGAQVALFYAILAMLGGLGAVAFLMGMRS
jgi:hypothetical protein